MTRLATCVFAAAFAASAVAVLAASPYPCGLGEVPVPASGKVELPPAPGETAMGYGSGPRCVDAPDKLCSQG